MTPASLNDASGRPIAGWQQPSCRPASATHDLGSVTMLVLPCLGCCISHDQVLKKLKDDLQHLLDKAAAADCRATSSSGGSSSRTDTADAVDGSKRDVVLSPAGQPVDQQQPGAHDSDTEEPAPVPGRQTLDSDHPFANVAIWQLPVMPLFFEADRTAAKQLAKDLMEALKAVN